MRFDRFHALGVSSAFSSSLILPVQTDLPPLRLALLCYPDRFT
jgi:hypothetical protein